MEALYLFLAVAAALVLVLRLKPALIGPPWLRAVIWVVMVITGLAIVHRIWGTVEAYALYLAGGIAVGFLVDRALPPRATGRESGGGEP